MNELDNLRRYAREEAEQAGLNEDQIAAAVDMAVGNVMCSRETGEIDLDYFEELVAGVIQGVANP
jgi:hypothetical protein